MGKTQLCMQLALDVQIPAALGGVAGEALYVDTEGSMMANRLEQIAAALHRHLLNVARRTQGEGSALSAEIAAHCAPSVLLERVHSMRCTELGEQVAVLASLPRFLEKHPAVRLVILDSVTFHFRYAESTAASSLSSRARLLQSTSQALHRAAASYNVAVVVINHMTTRISESGDDDGGGRGGGGGGSDGGGGEGGGGGGSGGGDGWGSGSRLVPALGETWAHACTNRVILRWESGVRIAQLVKSPSRRPGEVSYAVTPDGIRGCKPASAPAASLVGKRSAEAAGLGASG